MRPRLFLCRVLLASLMVAGPQFAFDIGAADRLRDEMVYVPAGQFTMGSETGEEDERPVHAVYLAAFLIDRDEVTVSAFSEFMAAQAVDAPFKWAEARKGNHRNKPVVGVDWFDARDYCRWRGKRLPTEAEWEKAARGTDGRTYPWGEDRPTKAHTNAGQTTWIGYDSLTSVGYYERGQSPYGARDMAGSVWEWVEDRYEQAYYRSSPRTNPAGPSAGPLRVLRGGAWNNDGTTIRSANRAAYAPNARRNDVGFRCAKDAG